MIVTVTDCRAAGHCVRGIREFFLLHRLDFKGFLRNGIDADVLLKLGDAQASNVVCRAKERDLDG